MEDARRLETLGVHYARLGNILNLASCHSRALDDETDNNVLKSESKLSL